MLGKSGRKFILYKYTWSVFNLYLDAPSWFWYQFKLTSGKTSINSDTLIFFQKIYISSLLIKTINIKKLIKFEELRWYNLKEWTWNKIDLSVCKKDAPWANLVHWRSSSTAVFVIFWEIIKYFARNHGFF